MKTVVIQIHKTTAMTYDTHMGDVERVTCSDRVRAEQSLVARYTAIGMILT